MQYKYIAAGHTVPPVCSAHSGPVINLELSPGPSKINRLILARLESGLTAKVGTIFSKCREHV